MSAIDTFTNRHYWAIVLVLIFAGLSLAATSCIHKSLTYDEPAYIGVGKYMMETGDVSTRVPGAPGLPFLVTSLFWCFLDFDSSFWTRFQTSETWGFTSLSMIFESGYDPEVLIFLARLPVMLTFPILGLLVFSWSRQLFGLKAGLFAVTLTAFCPNLLAHTRLAATDFLATLTIFAAFYFFRGYLTSPSWGRLLASGITLGIALLTKFTAIILVPSMFLLTMFLQRTPKPEQNAPTLPTEHLRSFKLWEKTRGQPRVIYSLVLMLIISFLVVWAAYFFEVRSLYVPVYAKSPAEFFYGGIFKFLFDKGIEIPAATYFVTLYEQVGHGQAGHPNFFMGEVSSKGHFAYFPIAFLIKTPLPVLLFLLWCAVFLRYSKNRKRGEEAFLLVPSLGLMAASCFSDTNIGLRLILPIFPFLFVWTSRLAAIPRDRWRSVLFAALVAWYIVSSVRIYPHYLEYFNELVGGPKNGYKYLVDSNLDWGQDLKLLLRHLKENDMEPVRIVYFGPPGLLEYYGHPNAAGDCSKIDEGYLAISATFLHSLYLSPGCYDWLKKYQPIDRVGYSIFIYRFPPKRVDAKS